MTARIFRPSKSATQSGRAGTTVWRLEFEPETPRGIDPLMGWTSTDDTQSQVRLDFPTRERAIAYCEKHGIPYAVTEPHDPPTKVMSYSDNFRYGRPEPWTH